MAVQGRQTSDYVLRLTFAGAVLLQRFLLWERRNNTVSPFKETVQQVWARISALRDSLDGPQVKHRATVFSYPPAKSPRIIWDRIFIMRTPSCPQRFVP